MANVHAYTLINYFDVWKDPDGGWIVNNQCVECDDLNITDDTTNKDILNYLASEPVNFLTTSDMRKVRLENLGDAMEIYAVKGHRPLGVLMPNY